MNPTPTEMLALYMQAESDILTNGLSTAFEGQVLTMANLDAVRKGRKEWEARVAAEQRGTGPSFPHSLASMNTR